MTVKVLPHEIPDLQIALAAYGALLDQDDRVCRGEKTTGVKLRLLKGRLRCESAENGSLLFSGPIRAETLTAFVESFWFWEKT